ncbi:MAG: hypothetical protein BWY65_02035 [Firmicutes bacterium ADurb.Bin373]|nr:MAG: hypothetical protein BWY65_02035 [Firmicutes bacterium ADurb.Bin373]
MERRANGNRHNAPGAGRLEQRFGSLQAGCVASYHHLTRAIQVNCLDHARCRSSQTDLHHQLSAQSQNGGHTARADRRRFLHILTTLAHQPDSIIKYK